MPGSKHIYLGLHPTEADAGAALRSLASLLVCLHTHLTQHSARAYDRAILLLKGSSAATNFDAADYGTEA